MLRSVNAASSSSLLSLHAPLASSRWQYTATGSLSGRCLCPCYMLFLSSLNGEDVAVSGPPRPACLPLGHLSYRPQ